MSAGGRPFHYITDEDARAIARQEIASLCGLVLRRCQDTEGLYPETLPAVAHIFGEALRDFGGTRNEPGEEE
jgi:hypothetical protein